MEEKWKKRLSMYKCVNGEHYIFVIWLTSTQIYHPWLRCFLSTYSLHKKYLKCCKCIPFPKDYKAKGQVATTDVKVKLVLHFP